MIEFVTAFMLKAKGADMSGLESALSAATIPEESQHLHGPELVLTFAERGANNLNVTENPSTPILVLVAILGLNEEIDSEPSNHASHTFRVHQGVKSFV